MEFLYVSLALIVLILFIDFRKGVLLYAPWKLFFNYNVRLGFATFDLFVSFVIICLFFLKRKQLSSKDFPLSKAFWIYGIGYTITCLIPDFAPAMIPRIVIMVLLFSYVYYCCLKDIFHIKFAVISYALFALVLCGNGLLEPLLGINPLDDFIQSVSDDDLLEISDNKLERAGQVRYRSFIAHSISYGVACCVILYLMLWQLLYVKKTAKEIVLIAIAFLLSGIVICGSRSPIIGLLPLFFLFFTRDKIISVRTKLGLIILVLLFMIIKGDYIIYMINSIIDPRVAYESGGSDMSLRLTQYALAFGWFLSSPIWGMGMKFDPFIIDQDIAGAESVWLPLLMNNGLIGTLSYAVIYWYLFKVSNKSIGRVYLLIITTGWFLMRTATSFMGVTDAQFFTVYFCIYRYFIFVSQNNKKMIRA